MIKAIIFDFGGVLVRTPNRTSRINLEKKYGLGDWGSDRLVFDSEMGQKAQLGQITDQELWFWIAETLSLSRQQLNDFQREFWAGDVLDDELVNYIQSLRPAYQTAILSNATDALRTTLKSIYPIADSFDVIVCSAEEGIMKPDNEIYEKVLQKLDREPSEVVFIDDSKANIEAARRIGINSIHFDAKTKLQSILAEAGVKGGTYE